MRTSCGFIILLVAAAVLVACSSHDSALVKNTEVGQLPAVVVPKRQPQVSPLRKKVLSLLEKKNYRRAVEQMKGRNHEGLEKEYILAINRLLEAGDDAFSLGDYLGAARSFKVALNGYPVEPSLREQVSRDPKRIRSVLEICVNRMMEQGLEEYRRGRLESAIRKWRGLLTISPGHQEAKKSIDTATVQLQALKNMKNR
jgi:hypothetical protein